MGVLILAIATASRTITKSLGTVGSTCLKRFGLTQPPCHSHPSRFRCGSPPLKRCEEAGNILDRRARIFLRQFKADPRYKIGTKHILAISRFSCGKIHGFRNSLHTHFHRLRFFLIRPALRERLSRRHDSLLSLAIRSSVPQRIGDSGETIDCQSCATSRNTAASIMTSSRGRQMIPRETISVVAPAGGWPTSNRTIQAPVAASESAAARIRGQKIPRCTPNGRAPAPVTTKAP